VPEIGTPGLMSGDGKRGDGHRPQATAPILDSTMCDIDPAAASDLAIGGGENLFRWVSGKTRRPPPGSCFTGISGYARWWPIGSPTR
jgi:hypothetical protein